MVEEVLGGTERLGLPWQSLGAFLRLSTNPRVYPRPLTPATAWAQVDAWFSLDIVWIPHPGPSYAEILGQLILRHDVRGNLISDAPQRGATKSTSYPRPFGATPVPS